MKIHFNSFANQTLSSLLHTQNKMGSTIEKLSTGRKINKSIDDTAGLSIATKLDVQIKSLQQANRNVMDGISLVQTAEGAYNEIHSILQRMRELTIQASNSTNTKDDTANIQLEIEQLNEELRTIQSNTSFNQSNLLNKPSADFLIQIGSDAGQQLTIPQDALDMSPITDSLQFISVLTSLDCQYSLTKIEDAIQQTSSIRSKLGAYQNQMDYIISTLSKTELNTTSAFSRIIDTDMAYEMAEMTRYNILTQSSTAILAQANQTPQQILSLLTK